MIWDAACEWTDYRGRVTEDSSSRSWATRWDCLTKAARDAFGALTSAAIEGIAQQSRGAEMLQWRGAEWST